MSTSPLPLLFLVFFLLLPFLSSSSDAGGPTVHELLPKYGLPVGLVPDAVESYTLSSNGEFEIRLSSPCYVHFSSLAYYGRTIRGRLSYGAISDLEGVQAKKLFLWVSVTGMVAHPDTGVIEFQVGLLSQSLPYSEFLEVPKCSAKSCHKGEEEEEALPLRRLPVAEA
ncbi:uncharacterized protein M6B38_366965 [Iris pallida]|uniref:DUF538 family protein n=1 Tax=Iris pallida TaxID=29817 RepID=A0AAX6GHE8_IRIPA|nr:uncharacterized protein M6B38_366965 [Iris pallida]